MKRLSRNDTPWHQWILQERSEFMEKMGVKRHRKMKVGRAAAKAAAPVLEVNHKLLTQNKGVAKANSSNYVLIYVRGKVVADKYGEGKGSANSGGGCGSVNIRPQHCMTVIMCTPLFIVSL